MGNIIYCQLQILRFYYKLSDYGELTEKKFKGWRKERKGWIKLAKKINWMK